VRTLVLGSSGMLGHVVAQALRDSGAEVVSVSRSGPLSWDAYQESFFELASQINLSSEDWVINCVGWIPQKSSGVMAKDSQNAERLNSGLLEEISRAQGELSFKWIQIGTDCVFSGKSGPYAEEREMDAADLYGTSKVAGERFTAAANLVRSSIVGPDKVNRSGLFEWFRTLPENSTVPGFTNQLWNGVSTVVFAKLSAGLIHSELSPAFRQHLVPLGFTSKYELLCIFRDLLGRADVSIVPTVSAQVVDRRLITNNQALNEELWHIAGYSRPQTIEEMCFEFVSEEMEGPS